MFLTVSMVSSKTAGRVALVLEVYVDILGPFEWMFPKENNTQKPRLVKSRVGTCCRRAATLAEGERCSFN